MKSVECEPVPVETAPGLLLDFDLVVAGHEQQAVRTRPVAANAGHNAAAVAIGRLASITDAGVPLVEVLDDGSFGPVAARTTIALAPDQIGSEVVLCFAAGDFRQPIIVGVLLVPSPAAPREDSRRQSAQVELNGQRLELTAEDELVLRCGKSSITLTKAGKVLIRGEYLLSRSSGVNRIKGGSVQIN